jgi:hypothetical protein
MFRLLLLALVITGMALPAQAEEELGTLMRLEEKLRQHPEIAGYVNRAESSNHYARGELGLPDPMLFIQEQDYPIGSSMSRDQEQKMIGFKQTIPAFGTRGAKSERMGVESRKNKLLGDYAFAAMKAKMITALAKLEAIREQEKLLDQQAALFGSERTSLKGRIAANQAGISQLTMSQADSTEVELMRAELEEEKHEIEAMLINMLGETFNSIWPEVTLPLIEMAAWKDDTEKTYPVVIAAADIDMARKDVDLRESEFSPNFEVQANYGRMNGGDNAGTIMVGLSIPLWASESQKPRLEGAKASVRAAESDQENIKRQTIEKLNHLKAQVDASSRKIELLKRKESLLSTSSGAQTREYEAGKADFTMPLKTRRDTLSVRYQLAAERAKHTALVADFNRYIVGESHE